MRLDTRRFWLTALWVVIGTLLVAGCSGSSDTTSPAPSSTELLGQRP